MKFYLMLCSISLLLGSYLEGKKDPLHKAYKYPSKLKPTFLKGSETLDLKQILEMVGLPPNSVINIADIGAFDGARSCLFAKQIHSGVIYSIDNWSTNINEDYKLGEDLIFDQFLSNINKVGTAKILPIWGTNDQIIDCQVFDHLSPSLNLVFLDVSTIYPSITATLENWLEIVEGTGVICGNGWGFHKLQEELTKFAEAEQLRLMTIGDYWLLKED